MKSQCAVWERFCANMSIEQRYQEILDSLKKGHRYLKPIDPELSKTISSTLNGPTNDQQLKKILCILDNTQSFCPEFEQSLIKIMQETKKPELIVFTLNALRKHYIARRFRQGVRLEAPFLKTLEQQLTHANPEVVEWTLRTIDECGAQAVYFKTQLKSITPPWWKLFNKNQRSIKEIITMLERRWSQR